MTTVIALEEHFTTEKFWALKKTKINKKPGAFAAYSKEDNVKNQLFDFGSNRIKDMDECGIDRQVLQFSNGGLTYLDPMEALDVVKDANDVVAANVRENPDRFSGFVQLPLQTPDLAIDEVDRGVNQLGLKAACWGGRVGQAFLDDLVFEPVWSKLEELNIPIYLHPDQPSAVVFEDMYSNLPGNGDIASTLAMPAFGWHSEMTLHCLRLVVSGLFDRHPNLHFIIGHMGEALPFYIDRSNEFLSPLLKNTLERPFKDYFTSNFHITTSGFFTETTFQLALATFGIDNILFSVDYPYSKNTNGKHFLDNLPLSRIDQEKIKHINAEKLLRL